MYSRTSSGKKLRVKSRYPESFRFLCLCLSYEALQCIGFHSTVHCNVPALRNWISISLKNICIVHTACGRDCASCNMLLLKLSFSRLWSEVQIGPSRCWWVSGRPKGEDHTQQLIVTEVRPTCSPRILPCLYLLTWYSLNNLLCTSYSACPG